jgi:hypothetical protein
MRPVNAFEARRLLEEDEGTIILDVRADNEFRRAHIDHPKVRNIPLDELPGRLAEIPKDRKILCLCLLGLGDFRRSASLTRPDFPMCIPSKAGCSSGRGRRSSRKAARR